MKSFLLACVAVLAIAVIAGNVLNGAFQTNSTSAFTTEGARISGGEQNLISN
jgi:multisubunit Na+/H+ antiporter MnhB subunit